MVKRNDQDSIFQFKITLLGIKPQIWRRIQVPSEYNFFELHCAIQSAMGWENYHLHQFDTNDSAGEESKIADYFSEKGISVKYEYDFGDGWEHKILLEKILPKDSAIKHPICTHGKRACPPEDCGGIWGYQHLLEILKDQSHPEYEERLEWLGDEFDPEKFDTSAVRFYDNEEDI